MSLLSHNPTQPTQGKWPVRCQRKRGELCRLVSARAIGEEKGRGGQSPSDIYRHRTTTAQHAAGVGGGGYVVVVVVGGGGCVVVDVGGGGFDGLPTKRLNCGFFPFSCSLRSGHSARWLGGARERG